MGIEQGHENAVAGFNVLLRTYLFQIFLIGQIAMLAGVKFQLLLADDTAVLVIEDRHALAAT